MSLDLGSAQTITRVDILWETALAWRYTLLFSATGSLRGPWSGAASISVTNGDGTGEAHRARQALTRPGTSLVVLMVSPRP